MSKEIIDEFYKRYSARIVEIDDAPLVTVMEGGRFKMLSIEEYEEMTNKISDLEAKLAEKEKEIEELKAQRRIYLNRSVEECNKITDLEFELQHKDQDKISFAVERLEKVKKFFLEEYRDEEMDTNYLITKDAGEIADYLLDQINELKRIE